MRTVRLVGTLRLTIERTSADTQYSGNGWGVGTTYQNNWTSSCRWESATIAQNSPCEKGVASSTGLYVQSDTGTVSGYAQHHYFDCLDPGGGCSLDFYTNLGPSNPTVSSGYWQVTTSRYLCGYPECNYYSWNVRGWAAHYNDTTDPYHYSAWYTSDGY